MSNCPCCGAQPAARHHSSPHPQPSSDAFEASAGALMADDDIATCCGMAQQGASARGSATVEVADFIIAMAAHRDGCEALVAAGLQPADAATAARGMLAAGAMRSVGHAPVLSDDLLALLLRAEGRALRRGAGTVTLADMADALVRESRDLASAQFVAQTSRGRDQTRRQRQGERSGARGLHHSDGRSPERTDHLSPLTPARRHGSAARSNDPFELRVDVGREDELAASFAPRAAAPVNTDWMHQRSDQHGGRGEAVSCDTRHLERQIADLAQAREASARDTARHREATQLRLDGMSRDIAALKDIIGEAFATLEGRLSEFGAGRRAQHRDGATDDHRLALIEAALDRLETSIARQGGARSASAAAASSSSSEQYYIYLVELRIAGVELEVDPE